MGGYSTHRSSNGSHDSRTVRGFRHRLSSFHSNLTSVSTGKRISTVLVCIKEVEACEWQLYKTVTISSPDVYSEGRTSPASGTDPESSSSMSTRLRSVSAAIVPTIPSEDCVDFFEDDESDGNDSDDDGVDIYYYDYNGDVVTKRIGDVHEAVMKKTMNDRDDSLSPNTAEMMFDFDLGNE